MFTALSVYRVEGRHLRRVVRSNAVQQLPPRNAAVGASTAGPTQAEQTPQLSDSLNPPPSATGLLRDLLACTMTRLNGAEVSL